jgi:two-component system NtrC family sensor kinase
MPAETEVAPRPLSILLVDDQEAFLSLLSEALSDAGHHVRLALSGGLAFYRLVHEDCPVDAVVTDVRMPGLDGVELYRRTVERRPELARRFVFITGDTNDLEPLDAPVLAKPFTVDQLVETIQKL